MYNDYFGFREAPFSIAPDPRYLFMSERHREALAHLIFGVRSDGGFVLLTGEVGTGKTTVCRCLLEQLPAEVDIALVLNPKLSALELLATVCDELRIAYPEGSASCKLFVDRINAYLLAAHSRGRKTVLIVDEAQNLAPEVLEQVRLLTNLETNQRKLLQIIMLGQPELRDLLARPDLRQLSQRITARYHLGPLTLAEVEAYLNHRLSVAGQHRQLFPRSTVGLLYRLSGGIPRLINILCDRALLGTYVQGRDTVNRATLAKAAREVFGEGSPGAGGGRRRPAWRWPLAAGLVVSAAVLAFNLTSSPGRLPAAESARSELPLPVLPPAVEPVAAPVPPPSVTPPTALARPAGLTTDQSRLAAYRTVFGRWGVTFGAGDGEACAFAPLQGLECLHRRGSLGSLRQLDLPAVLRIFDDQREEYYAGLIALGPEDATLTVGDQTLTVPAADLANRWLGDFTVLWRRPAEVRQEIRPGDRGERVSWLARRLAAVQGEQQPPPADPVLTGELLRRVEAFQRSRGLEPDGIVGPQTLIHLDAADGPALGSR